MMYEVGTLEHIRNYFLAPILPLANEVLELEANVQKIKTEFEENHQLFDFNILLKHRILASNTLRKGEGLVEWENASKYVAQQVMEDKPLVSDQLEKINSILAGTKRTWRTTRIFSADEEYIPPEFINEFRQYFDQNLPRFHSNPTLQAFLAYCWSVTIHGFENQNGRTSRLACDWILLQNGYVPIHFSSPIASHVAQKINGRILNITGLYMKFLDALHESYELMRIK